jgi:hypothetical protein
VSLGTIAAILGLGGFLVLLGTMLASAINKPKPTTIPATPATPATPAKRPAPTEFSGVILSKPAFDEGERIPFFLAVARRILPTDGPCAIQRGFVDNGSGPYKVRARAFRGSDGKEVPIYRGDTGPVCSGVALDSPAELVVYANAVRPYTAIGSGFPCGFVSLDDGKAEAKCGDSTSIVPPTNIDLGTATDSLVFHFSAINADGEESAVWEQRVGVVPSHCGKKSKKR